MEFNFVSYERFFIYKHLFDTFYRWLFWVDYEIIDSLIERWLSMLWFRLIDALLMFKLTPLIGFYCLLRFRLI